MSTCFWRLGWCLMAWGILSVAGVAAPKEDVRPSREWPSAMGTEPPVEYKPLRDEKVGLMLWPTKQPNRFALQVIFRGKAPELKYYGDVGVKVFDQNNRTAPVGRATPGSVTFEPFHGSSAACVGLYIVEVTGPQISRIRVGWKGDVVDFLPDK